MGRPKKVNPDAEELNSEATVKKTKKSSDLEAVKSEAVITEEAKETESTPTPHNAATNGDIAPFVLLPGDPMRAKYISKHFLKDTRMITDIRGILGFTGTYDDKPVSVIGSGMGGPSVGIYSYELFAFYGVSSIVRVGTAAGFQSWQNPGDLVFAMTASTDSNYAHQYQLPGTFCPSASFSLLKKAVKYAKKNDIIYSAGSVFSSDIYSEYSALGNEKAWKPWADMGCLSQDMETYALYCNAAYLKKNALSIVTNVSICPTGKKMDTGDFSALEPMIRTALSLV